VILDGEVIVRDARGASDFEALQSALRERGAPLIFYVFDLLHRDGRDLRNEPLIERRRLDPDPQSVLQFSEEFAGDGAEFFKAWSQAPSRRHCLEACHRSLPQRPIEDLAKDQVLHRKRADPCRYRSGQENPGTPRTSRQH
jgi:hypothetical protein